MTTLELDDRLTKLSKHFAGMSPGDIKIHLQSICEAAYREGWDDAIRTREAGKKAQALAKPGVCGDCLYFAPWSAEAKCGLCQHPGMRCHIFKMTLSCGKAEAKKSGPRQWGYQNG